jgi:hypothetical protein
MRRMPGGIVLLALAALVCGSPQRGNASMMNLNEICGPETVLSFVGVDTLADRALFRIPGEEPGPKFWWLEVGAGEGEVELHPDWSAARRFSGSTGPGPVLVLERCGPDCVQVLRWSEATWQPIGGPLRVAATETVHMSWDSAGAPWVVLHEGTGQPGRVRATAFRGKTTAPDGDPGTTGLTWEPRGALVVRSVGSPALLPDPGAADAVLSGTGRFRSGGEPEGWLVGLPSIPDDLRGQIVPLESEGAFYLSGDGVGYVSADGGRHWQVMTWTPWSADPGEAGPRERGVDYSLDRPVGQGEAALELVWFDDRVLGEEKVVLSEGGLTSWKVVATLPQDLDPGGGQRPIEHILRLGPSWLLIGGCASREEGAGLVVRSVEGDVVSPIGLLPFVPSWLAD